METSTHTPVSTLEVPEEVRAEGTELGRLMAEVLGRPRGNRRDVADALNEALRALQPGLAQRDARALLVLLDEKDLDDTVDTHGQQVREVAVQALLRVGYPWALQIDPDDLSWFRSGARMGQSRLSGPARTRWWAWATAAAMLAVGAAGGWTIWGDDLRVALDLEGAHRAAQGAPTSIPPMVLEHSGALPRQFDGQEGKAWVELVGQRVGPPGFAWSEALPKGSTSQFRELRAEVYRQLDGTRVASWAFNELPSPIYRPPGPQNEAVRNYRLPRVDGFRPGESYFTVVRGRLESEPFAVRTEAFIPQVFGP